MHKIYSEIMVPGVEYHEHPWIEKTYLINEDFDIRFSISQLWTVNKVHWRLCVQIIGIEKHCAASETRRTRRSANRACARFSAGLEFPLEKYLPPRLEDMGMWAIEVLRPRIGWVWAVMWMRDQRMSNIEPWELLLDSRPNSCVVSTSAVVCVVGFRPRQGFHPPNHFCVRTSLIGQVN